MFLDQNTRTTWSWITTIEPKIVQNYSKYGNSDTDIFKNISKEILDKIMKKDKTIYVPMGAIFCTVAI